MELNGSWGDFVTARGPKSSVGSPVRYSMTGEFSKQYNTHNKLKQFTTRCLVRAENEQAFVQSILADVEEGYTLSQELAISPYSKYFNLPYCNRIQLKRYKPQRHPTQPNMYAVDANVVQGRGYPAKTDGDVIDTSGNRSDDLTFLTRPQHWTGRDPAYDTPVSGFVEIDVIWSELPYDVEPTDDEANAGGSSEMIRWCKFPKQNKGKSHPVRGQVFGFVDDDGTPITIGDSANLSILAEPPSIYLASQLFVVTWFAVPRVPMAADTLLNSVNLKPNLRFPVKTSPAFRGSNGSPEIGTILHLGYELSERYYTVSGTEVYDLTYHLLYRRGSEPPAPARGHNSSWCGQTGDLRMIIHGELNPGKTAFIDPTPIAGVGGGGLGALPRLTGDDIERISFRENVIHGFGDLANLFRLEGDQL
jgi:hypothetical protein